MSTDSDTNEINMHGNEALLLSSNNLMYPDTSTIVYDVPSANIGVGLASARAPECAMQFPFPTASSNDDGDKMMYHMYDINISTGALPHHLAIFGRGGLNCNVMQDGSSGQAQHNQYQSQSPPCLASGLPLQSMRDIDIEMGAPHFSDNILGHGGSGFRSNSNSDFDSNFMLGGDGIAQHNQNQLQPPPAPALPNPSLPPRHPGYTPPPRHPPPIGFRVPLTTSNPLPSWDSALGPPPARDPLNGTPMFFGTAVMHSSSRPCKISHAPSPWDGAVVCVPCDGREMMFSGNFSLLPFDPASMELIRAEGGQIPIGKGAVLGGRDKGGEMLYHALATLYDHHRGVVMKVSGYCGEHLGGASVPYDGKEVFVREYELLCWRDEVIIENMWSI